MCGACSATETKSLFMDTPVLFVFFAPDSSDMFKILKNRLNPSLHLAMLKSPGQLPLADGGATFSLPRSNPRSALCLPPIMHHFYFHSQPIFVICLYLTPPLFPFALAYSKKFALSFFSGLLSVSLSVSLFCFFRFVFFFFSSPSLFLCQCPCGLPFSYFSFISALRTPFLSISLSPSLSYCFYSSSFLFSTPPTTPPS